MLDIRNYTVSPDDTIRDVLKVIDSGIQIALVVDSEGKLLGTVTDGDIRRALLNEMSLGDTIRGIYFDSPVTCPVDTDKESLIQLALEKGIKHIPLVDQKGCLVGIEGFANLLKQKQMPNKVVLMAGGLGKRLRPLTENVPKPMLNVGNKPILETILENFKKYGFKEIYITVNYLSNMIKEHFGDGSDFGVSITYVQETERLGTAGALSLIKDELVEPFIVMNGDLLTSVNFEHLMEYHRANEAEATMCVREYDFQVPYGVVNLEENNITGIDEKPIHKFFVSAGIYVLSPGTLSYIPENEYYDMPTLFEAVIAQQGRVVSFPLREYWIDIGHLEDYKKANEEYKAYF